MKQIKLFFFSITCFFLATFGVQAAGSIATNASSVYVGSTITITVKITNAAAWEAHIKVSGASNCGTLDFADSSTDAQNTSKTYTTTCKATKVGTASFTLSGNTTTAGGATSNISGTKTVTIKNKPAPTPTPNTPVTPKSSVNYLKSLSIDNQKLSPNFDKQVNEYSVELEPGTTAINIKAAPEHTKAKVTGTGKIKVSEGLNTIKITVTAENGSKRTYTIKATVKEKDPIIVKIGDSDYTVVRKKDALPEASSYYKETQIEINGEKIPAYLGEITEYTLVGLKDEDGNIALYVYQKEKNTYERYKEYNFGRVVLHLLTPETKQIPKEFEQAKTTLNEEEIPCFKWKTDEDIILLYGMNIETKNIGFYQYDKEENTLIKWNPTILNVLEEEIKGLELIVIGLLAIILIILFAASFQGSLSSKKKTKKDTLEKEVAKEDKKEIKKEKKLKKREEKEKKKKHKNSLNDTQRIDIDDIQIKK